MVKNTGYVSISFPIYNIFTGIKNITRKLDFMLLRCPVISRWAVKFSKQNLLFFFFLIKEKTATVQNSFWFSGAEGRFQEIKQWVSEIGLDPGSLTPAQRWEASSRSGTLFIFPKDGGPGHSTVPTIVHHGEAYEEWGRAFPCPFSNWETPGIETGWVGGAGGQPRLGQPPGELGDLLVGPDLLVTSARCSLEHSYSTLSFAVSKGRR